MRPIKSKNKTSKPKKFGDGRLYEQSVIDFSTLQHPKTLKGIAVRKNVSEILKSVEHNLKLTIPRVKNLFSQNSVKNKTRLLESLSSFKKLCVDYNKLLIHGEYNSFPKKSQLKYAVNFIGSRIVSIEKLLNLRKIIDDELKTIKDLEDLYSSEVRIEPREAEETMDSIKYWKTLLDKHKTLVKTSFSIVQKQYAEILALEKHINLILKDFEKS